MSVLEKSLVRIFRVCCLLFSYQCSFLLLPFHATAFILYQSVSCLSTTFLNYFLLLFRISRTATLIYYHISSCLSITFLKFFSKVIFKQNGERGIRTLAPLLTTYSLSRGAPSASLGISPKRPLFNIHDSFFFVQYYFQVLYITHLQD